MGQGLRAGPWGRGAGGRHEEQAGQQAVGRGEGGGGGTGRGRGLAEEAAEGKGGGPPGAMTRSGVDCLAAGL